MMKKVELAIVGGGYAGLSCARVAAGKGLQTLLIDRKKDLGEKIRTTGLLVGEAAEEIHLPASMKRKVPGVRLYSPNGKFTDLHSPEYAFWAVDTPAMIRWMGEQAELAGAEIATQTNLKSARQTVTGVEFEELGIHSRFAVGADGARSNFAKSLGYRQNTEFLVGAEEEWAGVKGLDPRFLHVFIDKKIAPGYIAWVVPGVGVAQVGVAVRKPHQPKLQEFMQKIRGYFDFSQATIVEKRGGLIPCGGGVRRWSRGNSMLLGDAAGWVSPLTAGGIYPAIRVGKAAGESIANYIQNGAAHPREVLSSMAPQYRSKLLMRKSMDAFQPPNWMMNLAIGNPVFERVAQAIFFHHRGLKDPKAWKAMFMGTARLGEL